MHSTHIHHCLELAANGRGKVSPNPLVGCVIVHEGKIIAEGWHEEFGGEHAEVSALELVAARHALLIRECTLYVNLEPCCSEGKQPPCTDAIIEAGIGTVVFGARDPSNRGSDILKNARIKVIGPVMEAQCRRLNRGFFSMMENGRPWVTLKKAMRSDRSIDGKITNDKQDAWAHENLRATHDAILVGSGTIIADNPQLNIRSLVGALRATPLQIQPRRIILDPNNKLPPPLPSSSPTKIAPVHSSFERSSLSPSS